MTNTETITLARAIIAAKTHLDFAFIEECGKEFGPRLTRAYDALMAAIDGMDPDTFDQAYGEDEVAWLAVVK